MITVRDIMMKDVLTFDISINLGVIIKTMVEKNNGCVIILHNQRLAGIVTERDIIRKITYHDKRLSDVTLNQVMETERELITITPEHTIMEAAKLMKEHKIKYLPVAYPNGMFVGLVTQTDIVHNLNKMFVMF